MPAFVLLALCTLLSMVSFADPDGRDAATCVDRAVADAHRKLDAVIQARLAEREAQTTASASGR